MVSFKTAIFALILFITFWVVNALAQDPMDSIFWEPANYGEFIQYNTPDVKKIYRFELSNGEFMHTDIDSKVTFSWKLDIFHEINPQPINPPYPYKYYFFRITVSDYDRNNVPSDIIVNINGAFRYYYNADKDAQADQVRFVAYSPDGWFNVNGDIRANLQSRIVTQSFGEVDPGSFPKFGTETDFAIIARETPVPNPSSENPGENSANPPTGDSDNPSGEDSSNPPPTGNSDNPSGEDSSNPPPTGNSGNPPPTGNSGNPPPTGNSGNPPPTGSSGNPPPTGNSGNPPTGSSGNPPPTGNSGNPPPTGSSGNSGNPPPTGNSGNPPAGESNNNPGHSTNQPGNSQQPQKTTDDQVRNDAQGNRTAWLLAIAIAVFTIVLDIVM